MFQRVPLRLLASAAFCNFFLAAPGDLYGRDEWQDPTVIGRHKQPAHATLTPFATVEQALEGTREASPFFQSLNGDWTFHWVEKPADRPPGFHAPGFDDSTWATIPVPSNWQLHGVRPPHLHQPALSVCAGEPGSAEHSRSRQPGRLLPHDLHHPRSLEGAAGLPPLRRGQERLLRLGQRRGGGLQPEQHEPG